ncbi:MAG: hypothetical protein CVU12_08715 [Bacteroidetes bacterium HGW-Bacteroidetes-7]|jgi:signal transduction histidine kinase|nr:MAG: hypothetical protein CVU12_08715 [Bacteroidetes bacterium HGW-Bacteroidetes-7]
MCHLDNTKEQLIDALKQRELEIVEALKLKRDLYSDLANSLPTGMYRTRVFYDVSLIEDKWSSSKDSPYVIEFANDRFYEILHLDKLTFEKNPGIINDLIYEEDKADFARLNVEANLHKIPFSWEGRFLINDQIIWIHFKSIPRVLENGDIIWTGTLEDISRRKQTEQVIRHKNAQLQKLNSDKDYLMSVLAHDLKSPFNTILGFMDLLINNLRSFDIDEIEKQLILVNDSALNAFRLLEDILLWARSQSNNLQFEPKKVIFKPICDKIIETLKPNAQNKNISINYTESEQISVFADINMLNTILRNLISNAIKFTNNGGRITINAQRSDSGTTVTVSDNGVGIAPEMLPKLFDIKVVYSTKGTAQEKGTGLGLLLCKEFVNKHGGKIWVESQLKKGSEFKFTLPLNETLST